MICGHFAHTRLALTVGAFALATTLCTIAQANAPAFSLRPDPRPASLGQELDENGALIVALPANALSPSRSPRPVFRPGSTPTVPVVGAAVVTVLPEVPSQPIAQDPRPTHPQFETEEFAGSAVQGQFSGEDGQDNGPPRGLVALLSGQQRPREPGVTAVSRSLRPLLRPNGLGQSRAVAIRNTPSRVAQPPVRGSVCGDRGIRGEVLSPVVGRINGCGIQNPVRVVEIDGVTLTTPATINCDTARAVQDWLEDSVVPEVGRRGGGVANLRVVASYSCRTRNNQPGARLSEHSHGNAIDIAGIGLADGSELTVLTDWGSSREGRILSAVHQGACGPFGTVLGPNSDRFHRDHFHFDVASYRSGPYCR